MATVYELMPVTRSSNQSATVTKKVMMTTHEWNPFCMPPSIFSSIRFCVKGKTLSRIRQLMNSRMSTKGNMNIIHWPKPSPRFRPSGSFRYFRAMVLGGVPIGVPMPPRLAATGIDIASEIRPLPSGGNWWNTGVRNVSIIAAVAVLETNIENRPVISRNPRSTISLRVPKGLSNTLANCASRPVFVAAIASTKPPINSMITGSANVAITPLYERSFPTSASFTIGKMPLSVQNNSISTIMATDVAQEETISRIHISVAKAKMAMIRCWMTVRFWMPYHSAGMFQSTKVTNATRAILMTRFVLSSGWYFRWWRILWYASTRWKPS